MVWQITPTQAATVVATTGNISDFIWSSDGTRVAFIKHNDGESWGELWVGDWDGYGVMYFQSIYSYVDINCLHDWQGDWILFQMRRENGVPEEYYGRNELWKIRDDGTDLTQVTFTYTNGIKYTENGNYLYRGSVNWGRFIPGTDLVYFSAHNGNGWYKSYTCFANGTDGWRLISGSYYAFTIGISSTGNKLLWGTASYYNEPITLMASNVNGSGVVTIKSVPAFTTPLVLADGDTVVYGESDGSIRAIQMNGTNDRVILDDEYQNSWVNYHPTDGQTFLMRSNRTIDGNNHIYSINVDGSDIEQLTDGEYNDHSAMFSPSGQNLLYRRILADPDETSYELAITGASVRPPSPDSTTTTSTTTTTISTNGLMVPMEYLLVSVVGVMVVLIIAVYLRRRKGV